MSEECTFEDRLLRSVRNSVRSFLSSDPPDRPSPIVRPGASVSPGPLKQNDRQSKKHCCTCRCFPPSGVQTARVRPYRPEEDSPDKPNVRTQDGGGRPPAQNVQPREDVGRPETPDTILLDEDDSEDYGVITGEALAQLFGRTDYRDIREGDFLRHAWRTESPGDGDRNNGDAPRTLSPFDDERGRSPVNPDSTAPRDTRRSPTPTEYDVPVRGDDRRNRRTLKRVRRRVYRIAGGGSDSSLSSDDAPHGDHVGVRNRQRRRLHAGQNATVPGPSTSASMNYGAAGPSSSYTRNRPPTTLSSSEEETAARERRNEENASRRSNGSRPPTALWSSDDDTMTQESYDRLVVRAIRDARRRAE